MKKNLLKVVAMLIACLSVLFSFIGCGKASGEKEKNTNNEVVVGMDDTFVPMGFRDDKGNIVGFDVDLAREVFKRMDKEVKFQPIDWSMKEQELKNKNIDVIWNGYSINEKRKQQVSFTQAYLKNRQVIITLSDSKINSKENLKDKVVAAQAESSSLEAINSEPNLVKQFKNGEVILFDTNNDALMDLEAGRTDAVVADEIMIRYYIKSRGEEKYKILKDDFGDEEYGIGIRKEDKEFLENINKTLDDMREDGTMGEISIKWFGENIINTEE